MDYQLIPYEVSGEHLSAGEVAGQLGENASQVFKTLVLTGDRNGIVICVVPGDAELNLKAVAKASANKKVEMLPLKELLSVTGYVRGGCSPIGMKKYFPTFIHLTALDHDRIYVSAGVRGLQVCMAPHDLIRVSKAILFDLVQH